jgi:hypothetical protein
MGFTLEFRNQIRNLINSTPFSQADHFYQAMNSGARERQIEPFGI